MLVIWCQVLLINKVIKFLLLVHSHQSTPLLIYIPMHTGAFKHLLLSSMDSIIKCAEDSILVIL